MRRARGAPGAAASTRRSFAEPTPSRPPRAARAGSAQARPAPSGVRSKPARARFLIAAVAAGLASCASPSGDIALAPLVSHVSRAGGGREVEALAGAVRLRRETPTSPIGEWALRPLVSRVTTSEGALTHFLVPFGRDRRSAEDTSSRLIPLYWYLRSTDDEGARSWRFFCLPGIYANHLATGQRSFAWFPFGGHIESFLSWDAIDFVLFPLFAHTRRVDRHTWHVLWPFLGYGENFAGGHSLRIFPLYSESIRPGSSERRSVLWPIFYHARDGLDRPPEERTSRWSFLPLIGRMRRGSYSATTVLWPFFGWASDSESGFRAWDGPWPLVRLQRPGANPEVANRTRFWPFWSHFENRQLSSTYWAWPFVNLRSERYDDGSREATVVIPFWQDWDRVDTEGTTLRSFRKLWPLFYAHTAAGKRRWAFPALNPLWPTPILDDHYAWLWELFAIESSAPEAPGAVATRWRSERSWGGLWRRERDAHEDRAYLSGLWSRRRARDDAGPLTETSLLFGLLRWRSRPGDRFDPMRPAFPGPGWPAHRSTELR